jgi:hypothetical protein
MDVFIRLNSRHAIRYISYTTEGNLDALGRVSGQATPPKPGTIVLPWENCASLTGGFSIARPTAAPLLIALTRVTLASNRADSMVWLIFHFFLQPSLQHGDMRLILTRSLSASRLDDLMIPGTLDIVIADGSFLLRISRH